MGVFLWLGGNWPELVQSLGIAASLLFAAHSLRLEAKSRRTANLLEITKAHREIWTELLRRPELFRVIDATPDLKSKPMTAEERLLIRFLILHLNVSYQAMKNGMFVSSQCSVPRFFRGLFPFDLRVKREVMARCRGVVLSIWSVEILPEWGADFFGDSAREVLAQ